MSQVPMPLPQADYQVMGCSRAEFLSMVQDISEETRYYIVNATHRLAEVDWIACRLEEEVSRRKSPVTQEGLLSLQIYLLLTCADTLGHVHIAGTVGRRFSAFFENLPQEAQRNLIDNIFTWRTNFTKLVSIGLGDATKNIAFYPSRQQIIQFIQTLTPSERLEAVVDFLYRRRNYYTHESEYPQLGHHQNLSVMQRQRLDTQNATTLGELDRLQPMFSGDNIYFTYYKTDDVVATIRWSVVRGLGQIIGSV